MRTPTAAMHTRRRDKPRVSGGSLFNRRLEASLRNHLRDRPDSSIDLHRWESAERFVQYLRFAVHRMANRVLKREGEKPRFRGPVDSTRCDTLRPIVAAATRTASGRLTPGFWPKTANDFGLDYAAFDQWVKDHRGICGALEKALTGGLRGDDVCTRGHEPGLEDIYVSPGGRPICRICKQEYQRTRRVRLGPAARAKGWKFLCRGDEI